MKAIQSFFLAVCLCFTVASAGCGEIDSVPADDVVKTGSSIVSDSSTSGKYYGTNISMIRTLSNGSLQGVTSSGGFFNTASPIPGYSYRVEITSPNWNVGMNCQLYMNWSAAGVFPPTAPANIPYWTGGFSHWVTGSSYSWCRINGVYQPMPAGAVEFWETSISPAVGQVAGYLVFRIPGWWMPMTAPVIRTVG